MKTVKQSTAPTGSRYRYPHESESDFYARALREQVARRKFLEVQGPLYPATVKGRSKRGWTTPKP